MILNITEYSFLSQLASHYKLPVPRHLPDTASRAEIKKAMEEWGSEAIVKPDVLTGKRGKAGSIVKVKDVQQALRKMKVIANTEINGKMPRAAYLVEPIPSKLEMYTALTYNSSMLSPSLTISLEGGVDIETVEEEKKVTIPIDIFKGLNAYQAGQALLSLGCEQELISNLSRLMVSFWDLFHSSGMKMAEINPWRITPDNKPYACDFKAIIDEANYKSASRQLKVPDYPGNISSFEEEMDAWSSSSYQGQAHVSDLGGEGVLPILFGGGASTIITETLLMAKGDPMFLSDFGGNPPYERMKGTAKICFEHKLANSKLLLILGGKANNTFIDVTFRAIGDALVSYVQEHGPVNIPVVVGRGGPRLVSGLMALKQSLEYLKMPYVIFGPDTPVTMVAEYAAKLANAFSHQKEAAV